MAISLGDPLCSFEPFYYGGYPHEIHHQHHTRRHPTREGLNLLERFDRQEWIDDLHSLRQSTLHSVFEENFFEDNQEVDFDDVLQSAAENIGPFVLPHLKYAVRKAGITDLLHTADSRDADWLTLRDLPDAYVRGDSLRSRIVATDLLFSRVHEEVDEIAGNWYGRQVEPTPCEICGRPFSPVHLRSYIFLGSGALTSCCMRCEIVQSPTREDLQDLVPAFVEACGFIPRASANLTNQSFTLRLPEETKLEAFRLYGEMGRISHVQKVFGSWFKGMAETGALPDGTKRTSRGTRCLAEDGHECHSLQEKQIDDWLYQNDIQHEREPEYPQHDQFNPTGGRRADWLLEDGRYVEYFGMQGDESYDRKSAEKRKLAEASGIELVEIYPDDLGHLGKRIES